MNKPEKFFLIHRVTKKTKPFIGYTEYPITKDLCEWVDIGNGEKELKQMWDAYIDTRYEAKLRLWNYINYTRKGLKIPKYEPFKGTEIGKTIPILNF